MFIDEHFIISKGFQEKTASFIDSERGLLIPMASSESVSKPPTYFTFHSLLPLPVRNCSISV